MPTLEGIEDATRTALTTAGYTVDASWAVLRPLPSAGPNAAVSVAQSAEINLSSNVTTRTVELVVAIVERASGGTAANMAALETLINGYLEALTVVSFWSAIVGVRSSPFPEVEVESEPERVGQCITFTIRARCALEA